MFESKSNLIVALIAVIVVAFFSNCEKQEAFDDEKIKESYLSEKVSLAEFIQSLDCDEEIDFFNGKSIIDNTSVVNEYYDSSINLKSESINSRWEIKFAWGAGCVNPIGICILIPLPTNQQEYANADVVIVDDKLVVMPMIEENGITTDGYLPIYEDLYVDENTKIKAGIYKAYYDEELKSYTAVALDIK